MSAAIRRALLIVNPYSRRASETNLEAFVGLLESSGFEVIQREFSGPDQSSRELEAYCDQVDLVMVAGGDGTIHSAAAPLVRHEKPVAILPLGTANDLARSIALPDDLLSIGHLVVEDQRRSIDVGVVNGRYFFNAVNIGLGTQITHELTEEVKRTWGVLSYFKALWATLSRKHAFHVTITVDGRRYRQRSIHLTVGNGRYYGGGNVVDQDAEIDNGSLCLYSIQPQPMWKLIFLAPLLRLGRQRLAKRTLIKSGRSIEINTSKPLEVHADGELVGHTPARLEVIPRALSVYAPPKRTSVLEALTETVAS